MKAKILLSLATATMFLGCSFFDDNQPIPKKPKQAVKVTPTKSSIKGFIKEVTYKDQKYCYEIVASDTKNNKLNKANFCANRYYHDKGDLVYATFYADKLVDMLLIKEGSSRGLYNGIRKPQNEVVVKRKNIKTNIEVPKEEKISFQITVDLLLAYIISSAIKTRTPFKGPKSPFFFLLPFEKYRF